MIAQEKEKHKIGDLSSPPQNTHQEENQTPASLPACPPHWKDSQPACQVEEHSSYGWNEEDLEDLERSDVVHPVLAVPENPPVPPYSNTGGTKCETHPYTPNEWTEKVQKVGIDWLAFSAQEPLDYFIKFVNRFLPQASLFSEKKGWQGYSSHYKINMYGQTVGILAYGGQQNKPYISLTGKACLEIEQSHDWEEVARVIAIFFDYKISRVDLKLDFFFNEINHNFLKQAYQDGKFKLPKARTNPKIDPREPVRGDGTPDGWTLYIGDRKGGKFFRGYEKGMEVFKKLPEQAQKNFNDAFYSGSIFVGEDHNPPEGATLKDWYRMEIEYKAIDRNLPIEILTDRDSYFAGSYPICQEVLKVASPLRPKTLPNNLDVNVALMLSHQGDGYGAFNYSLLSQGYHPIDILAKVLQGHWGHSQRYLQAGGLKDVKHLDPEILNPKNWTYTPPVKKEDKGYTPEQIFKMLEEEESFKAKANERLKSIFEEAEKIIAKDGYDVLSGVNVPKEKPYIPKKK